MADAPAIITSKKSDSKPRSLKTDTPTVDGKLPGQCKAPKCLSTSMRHATTGEEYVCPVHSEE